MDNFPKIRPITSQQELDALKAAAALDAHTPILPTHIFWRGEKIIGYASLCAMVMPGVPQPQAVQVNVWFDSKEFRPRESFQVINALENVAANVFGCRQILVPCSPDSPFIKVMQAMGYSPLFRMTLHGKTL